MVATSTKDAAPERAESTVLVRTSREVLVEAMPPPEGWSAGATGTDWPGHLLDQFRASSPQVFRVTAEQERGEPDTDGKVGEDLE
jgi:hypothetical protein